MVCECKIENKVYYSHQSVNTLLHVKGVGMLRIILYNSPNQTGENPFRSTKD